MFPSCIVSYWAGGSTGGIYPKRLVIGEVTAINKMDYGLFQEVNITPSVDFSKLEEVFILKQIKKSHAH